MSSSRRSNTGKRRGAIFAAVPSLALLLLLLAAEGSVRLAGLDRPRLRPAPLDAELAQIHQADDELFWTIRPGLDVVFQGVRVVTNSQGLRSPEVGPKAPGELRILSLGESTTFGAKIPAEASYSARLEALLNEMRVRVINAGVSAYTSFQSLKYLELRGLGLRPDIVLFYHEYNEHLPSTIRVFGVSERSLPLTDRQWHDSREQGLHRALRRWSAVYRWLSNRAAKRAVETMQSAPGTALSAQKGVVEADGGTRELGLPERVPPEDRRRNLEELRDACRRAEVRLVMIHPSYSYSRPHSCMLTTFCAENAVPMCEAFDALHPGGPGDRSLFLDTVHPTPEGHDRLARSLARCLVENGLLTAGAPRPGGDAGL